MKGSRASRSPVKGKRGPVQFTTAQVLRQLGLILLVVAIWAGLLAVTLHLTSPSDTEVAGPPPLTQAAVTTAPTQTPVPITEPLATATSTPTLAATATEPAASGTAGPTLQPTASEPPPSPTDTPVATEPPPTPTETATSAPSEGPSFSKEVLPVLTTRCQRCHGGDRTEAGLNLLSYQGVMAGSQNGPVVIPGSSATSPLVELIVSGKMPKRAPRLPETEIEIIRTWVDVGALDN